MGKKIYFDKFKSTLIAVQCIVLIPSIGMIFEHVVMTNIYGVILFV